MLMIKMSFLRLKRIKSMIALVKMKGMIKKIK